MPYLGVEPAYGRDYTSKAKVLEDWKAGKDFRINDMSSRYDGKVINSEQHPPGVTIQVRYNQRRSVVMIKPPR